MNNSRQKFVKQIIRDVYGISIVEDLESYGRGVGALGMQVVVINNEPYIKRVPFTVWFDKTKSGYYSIKVKPFGRSIKPEEVEEVKSKASTLLHKMNMVGDIDFYVRHQGFNKAKGLTLRLKVPTLPR